MTEASPCVSVIMPNYNASAYLPEAVASVLAQTFTDFEVIVCDDGSSDASREILARIAEKDTRMVVILQEQSGVAAARNAAMAKARGRYIALIDSDDVWHPHKLEVQIAQMQREGAAISHGNYHIIRADGAVVTTVKKHKKRLRYLELLCGHRIDCLTTVVDRTRVRVPLFAEGAQEDFAWSLNMLSPKGTQSHLVPHVLGSYRVLATSRSSHKWRNVGDVWQILLRQPISNWLRIVAFLWYLLRKMLLHSIRKIILWMSQCRSQPTSALS